MDNPAFVLDFEHQIDLQKNDKIGRRDAAHTFDEAITLTQVGKFHYFLLLICGLCFMSVMCEITVIGLILPSMRCDLTSTVSEQGILTSAGFFGIVLSSHAMGFLADTGGRVRLLRIAFMLSIISTFVSAFSVNIWMLIVLRFLTGFFISGGQACVFSYCGEFHGNKTRVRHITLLAGFLPLAMVILPSLAILILPLRIETAIFGMQFSSWRLLLMSNCLISLLALVGLHTLFETPKFVLVQGDHDGALKILQSIYARNTGRSREDYPVKRIVLETGGASLTNIHGFKDALKMIWHQTVPLFYKERFLHTLNICFCLFVMYGIAQGLLMWFPTILNEMVARNGEGLNVCTLINNMNPSTANLEMDACSGDVDIFMFQVLLMMAAAFVVFYLLSAYTIDYIGKKNLLVGWIALSGIAAAAVHWISDFGVEVVVLTLILSIGNCGGIVGTISMEFFPTNINAMGMCFIMMIGRLGAVAGSIIISQLLFNDCNMVYWVIFAFICVISVACLFLPERKRQQKDIQNEFK